MPYLGRAHLVPGLVNLGDERTAPVHQSIESEVVA